MEMRINRLKIITLVLAVLLIITLVYIALDIYQQGKQQEQLLFFQQGAQYGYEQAILQIVQQATTCQQVPLLVGNDTISIIAVGCLQPVESE
jgi:hypothetical protein